MFGCFGHLLKLRNTSRLIPEPHTLEHVERNHKQEEELNWKWS